MNIHNILCKELYNNINLYNKYNCFDINYIINDTITITKPLIINYIKLMIQNNYPLQYYFKNSIDYLIKEDIIQLQLNNYILSDLDINDIYIEHKSYIVNYLYHIMDIE